jgi:hypothetical protein
VRDLLDRRPSTVLLLASQVTHNQPGPVSTNLNRTPRVVAPGPGGTATWRFVASDGQDSGICTYVGDAGPRIAFCDRGPVSVTFPDSNSFRHAFKVFNHKAKTLHIACLTSNLSFLLHYRKVLVKIMCGGCGLTGTAWSITWYERSLAYKRYNPVCLYNTSFVTT